MQKNKYQVMPDLSEDEYNDLKADIAKRGVMVPIEFDEAGDVLDGHHRLRACEELGVTDYPTVTRAGMTEDEKILHAYKLNVARRHLTTEQIVATVAGALRRFPGKSNREIANITGISHPTVGKYRKLLEESGQVEKVATREGADGKAYSVRDRGESLLEKMTFTCCICGEEQTALYVRGADGRVANLFGYDPWPARTSGDCCARCNDMLMGIRDGMSEEVVNEHYFGVQWQEVLDAADTASKKIGHDWDRQDEFTAEFDRLLADRGICCNDKWSIYRAFNSSTTKTRLLLKMGIFEVIPDGSKEATAMYEAAKTCDSIETLNYIRNEAASLAREYASLAREAEKKELDMGETPHA